MTGGSRVRDVHATVYLDARARRAAAAVRAVRPDREADAGFVGRTRELAQLLDLLAPRRTTPSAADGAASPADDVGEAGGAGAAVSVVAGAPGVGKTALAHAAARTAVARGWFLGGAVTVDLHGYDPDPVQVVWPAQLYAGLLRALGVPGEQVPPEESEQATVYHQVLDQLAVAGRAVLVVLDDAGDPDQVAAVLPHEAGPHRVLITSRDSLARLPRARLLDLHVLDPAAAVELLATGLRRRHAADPRVADDPDAAALLMELCGRLPLAVQIVAALLADEPDRLLSDMADDLADEQHRLAGLDYGRGWAVRAAFDLSHRRLDPAIAELFALLAAVPGPDVGLAVAAAVADRDERTTRIGLRALCRAHLLDQQVVQPGGPGPRWRMHDLIRLYAAEQLTPDQRTAGFDRTFTYYRRSAALAHRWFTALPAQRVPAGFATARDAMAWVLQERAGLVATTVHAATTRPDETAALAADLTPFLARARLLADGVTVASTAVQATDRRTAAGAWNNLGLALRQVRRFDEAITAHQTAGEIFRQVGDRQGEGITWNNLGSALTALRRFAEAITAYRRAGDIQRQIGDRYGEAPSWTNLGIALTAVRRFDEAITAHRTAEEIFRKAGDRHSEALALNNVGLVLIEVCRFDEAIAACRQASDIFHEVGDRHGEAGAQGNLGNALTRTRRFDEAIAAHRQAGVIHLEIGDRHGEGSTWYNLGVLLTESGRADEAVTAFQRAGDIFQRIGDRHGQAQTWNVLGTALTQTGRFDDATTAYQHSFAIHVELGDRYGQGQLWENLGIVQTMLDRTEQARRAWSHAAELFTATRSEDDVIRVQRRITGLHL